MYRRCSSGPIVQQILKFSTTSCACKKRPNHYDSLGVTPKATQADIKTAYYELSKVYHPDRNEGSADASQKFRDITEAYEVLGNVNSRKLYDKGMSIGTTLGQHSYPTAEENKFYRSRETKTRPSASGGRQPIYDFDEWSRAHYGATFARDMAIKERRRMMQQRQMEIQHSQRMERILLIVGLLVASCMYLFYESIDYDYDEVGNKDK